MGDIREVVRVEGGNRAEVDESQGLSSYRWGSSFCFSKEVRTARHHRTISGAESEEGCELRHCKLKWEIPAKNLGCNFVIDVLFLTQSRKGKFPLSTSEI